MADIARKAENIAMVVAAYIVIGIGLGIVGWQHVTATDVVTAQLAMELQGIDENAVAGVLGFFQFQRFLGTVSVVVAAGVGGIVGIRTGDIDVCAIGCAVGNPFMFISTGVVVSYLVTEVPGLGAPSPFVFVQPVDVHLAAVTAVAGLVGGAIAASVIVLQP